MKRKQRKYTRFYDIMLLLVLASAALFNGPINRNYELESDKIENEIKIAVIADLHNQYFGENQKQLITLLHRAQPDIILMPGDMANHPDYTDATINLMEQTVNIAPCYYTIGNHEYWSFRADEIFEIVESTGVTVLRNESVTLDINGNTVELFGIDDVDAQDFDSEYEKPWSYYLSDLWTDNADGNYRILMSHRPETVESYSQYEYDLIVAGHSHGGQARIPFLVNGLWAPNQGVLPEFAGGEYEINDVSTMIVSRGLANYWYAPRVFCPSEIVIITISQNQ